MPEQNSSNNKLKDIFEYNSNSCSSLVIHLEGGRREMKEVEVAWGGQLLSNFEFNILNKNQFGDITSQIYM